MDGGSPVDYGRHPKKPRKETVREKMSFSVYLFLDYDYTPKYRGISTKH